MKVSDIAFKDLLRSLRTPFALVMMFGAPLLITGLLYLAFGNLIGGTGDSGLQAIRVQVANLDQPPAQPGEFAAGEMLVAFLQSDDLKDVLQVSIADSEADARAAVEDQRADIALIIPSDFTAAALAAGRQTAVTLYQDPTLTIAPGIVKDLVRQFIDGFAGAKITADVVEQQLKARNVETNPALVQDAAVQYAGWLESSGHDHGHANLGILRTRSPSPRNEPAGEGAGIIGPIMTSMMIFFAFFMGANSAESIIREDEEGTLARLFVTPTPQAAILGGKFAAVVLTLVVQVLVLLLAAGLAFGIRWGKPLPVILATLGLIVSAAGFGILVMSFVRNTRQVGPVLGGVLTLTGMLGGLFTSGVPNMPGVLDTVRLAVPQGWALAGWELALGGASAGEMLLPVAAMLGMGVLFFVAGVFRFRKRFA